MSVAIARAPNPILGDEENKEWALLLITVPILHCPGITGLLAWFLPSVSILFHTDLKVILHQGCGSEHIEVQTLLIGLGPDFCH